ncbi:MAG: hypothetical protein V1815_00295, partial [Candidatus Woesearchaeota archaeon]
FGYFSTHNNIIDLSRTGYYSQEKLADIYNKANGTNIIEGEKGKWYDEMQSAFPCNTPVQGRQPDGSWAPTGGVSCGDRVSSFYFAGLIYPVVVIYPQQTIHFFIDPYKYSNTSIIGGAACGISVKIIDFNQNHGQGNFYTRYVTLDRQGNELSPPTPYGASAGNGVYQIGGRVFGHRDDKVYLFSVDSYLNEPAELYFNWGLYLPDIVCNYTHL